MSQLQASIPLGTNIANGLSLAGDESESQLTGGGAGSGGGVRLVVLQRNAKRVETHTVFVPSDGTLAAARLRSEQEALAESAETKRRTLALVQQQDEGGGNAKRNVRGGGGGRW